MTVKLHFERGEVDEHWLYEEDVSKIDFEVHGCCAVLSFLQEDAQTTRLLCEIS